MVDGVAYNQYVKCIRGTALKIIFHSLTLCRIVRLVLTSLCALFDISTLLPCVPLKVTINICTDVIYRSHLCVAPTWIPQARFVKFMNFATMYAEFSFYKILYSQISKISMSKFIRFRNWQFFYEQKLFARFKRPNYYFGYVDDTFCVFDIESEFFFMKH